MAFVAVVSLLAFLGVGVLMHGNLKTGIDQALESALDYGSEQRERPYLGAEGGRANSLLSYSVTVTWDGTIYADADLDTQMNADVLASAVQTAIDGLDGKASTQGRIEAYNLYYAAKVSALGYRVAFVDSSSFDRSMARMLAMLAVAWLLLMLALLLVAVFLSRYATKPVAEAWENQQRFIADASHELKTPLTVILADAAILGQSPEKTVGEQSKWLEGISSEAERMRHLTEDLLALAQADAKRDEPVALCRVDLSTLAQRAVLQFEAAAFERGLVIEDGIEPGIEVMGSADKLEGMVKTLLENACKYGAGSGAPVTVSLRRQHGSALLSVGNGGAPIPPEDLPHVFERFYRSDKSRVQDGESLSFGLGLAIAKSTAELHKGSIKAESSADGTVFSVALPLAK